MELELQMEFTTAGGYCRHRHHCHNRHNRLGSRVLLAFLVCWQLILLAGATEQKLGELRPVDPNVTVGQPLDMFCEINNSMIAKFGQNASKLYMVITRGNVEYRIPNQYYAVANANLLVMKYTQLNESNHESTLCCHLLDHNHTVDCQFIWVGYKPFKPTVRNVSVSNWEWLSFSWTAERKNLNYKTTYVGWWRTSNESDYHNCTKTTGDRGSCQVQVKATETEMFYVKVKATNLVGKAHSEEVAVHVDKIVAPGRVQNLQAKTVGKRSITLTWDSPKQGHSLMYKVIYNSKWNKSGVLKMVPATTETTRHVTLLDLVPFTEYSITVSARPAVKGRWGPTASLKVDTTPAAPEVAPLATSDAYNILQQSGPRRTVRLHWKAVPEKARNGPITDYCVKYLDMLEHWRTECSGSQLWVDVVSLYSNRTYHFYTEAKGPEGDSDLSVRPITVPSTDNIPDVIRNFTVIVLNDSSVQLSWEPNRHLKSATVFWCLGQESYLDRCKGDLEWETTDNTSSVHITEFKESPYLYQFGLSGQTPEGSTGIHWSTCIHDNTRGAPPPQIEVKKQTGHSLVLFVEPPSCSPIRGFIRAYKMEICQIDSEEETECQEIPKMRTFAAVMSNLYEAGGLKGETLYLIKVASVTTAGTSVAVAEVTAETAQAGLAKKWIVLISILAFICLICFLVGIFACFSSLTGAYLKCRHWFKQPIERPQVYQIPLQGVPDQSGEPVEDYLQTRRTYMNENRVIPPVGRTSPIIPNNANQGSAGLSVDGDEDCDSRSPLLKHVLPPVSSSGQALVSVSPDYAPPPKPVLPPLEETPKYSDNCCDLTDYDLATSDDVMPDSDSAYRKTALISEPWNMSTTEQSPEDNNCTKPPNNNKDFSVLDPPSLLPPKTDIKEQPLIQTSTDSLCNSDPCDAISKVSPDTASIENYAQLASNVQNPSDEEDEGNYQSPSEAPVNSSSNGYARTKVTESDSTGEACEGDASPANDYAPTNLVLTNCLTNLPNGSPSDHLYENAPKKQPVTINADLKGQNAGALQTPNGILPNLHPPIKPTC